MVNLFPSIESKGCVGKGEKKDSDQKMEQMFKCSEQMFEPVS